MEENSLKQKYMNLLGDTKEMIDAIQKFITQENKINENSEIEEKPAESVNRILNSVASEEINNDIRKIIENL